MENLSLEEARKRFAEADDRARAMEDIGFRLWRGRRRLTHEEAVREAREKHLIPEIAEGARRAHEIIFVSVGILSEARAAAACAVVELAGGFASGQEIAEALGLKSLREFNDPDFPIPTYERLAEALRQAPDEILERFLAYKSKGEEDGLSLSAVLEYFNGDPIMTERLERAYKKVFRGI